ncbi:hypothetical protein [Stutzerimonas nitrititolerans]|uniref:hypothetical protein n=1 Tax=Stutzerimonas nitrititolerans TaxID=2482751 RepID=UPI00128F9FCB|nr:hypothetical protein [Stutzerimonas nitrititolerans]HJE28535.1 hypothetical protein [Stutzerimonas nitrititolerans]
MTVMHGRWPKTGTVLHETQGSRASRRLHLLTDTTNGVGFIERFDHLAARSVGGDVSPSVRGLAPELLVESGCVDVSHLSNEE